MLNCEEIPFDCGGAFFNVVRRRIQPAVTLQLAGRKLTGVIDGHNQEIEWREGR